MANILIDANIYLSLYGLTSLRELLPALIDLRNHIFVSQQIVAEVERNKLHIAKSHLEDHAKRLAISNINAPDFLILGAAGESELAKRLKEQHKAFSTLRQEVKDLGSNLLAQIAKGEDEVSKQLQTLFAQAAVPTVKQLERARLRRELGNPPGYPDQPLGDQLTWEQFLDQLQDGEVIWVISNDQDYSEDCGEQRLLKPPLYSDLKLKSPRSISIFSKLAEALADIQKAAPKETARAPDPQRLQAIAKEENPYVAPEGGLPDWCPRCGTDSWASSFEGNNARGGVSGFAICGRCGLVVECYIKS